MIYRTNKTNRMKGPVKSFTEFRSQLHESKIEEASFEDRLKSAKDAVVGALKKLGDLFSGVGSAFMNIILGKSEGAVPKAVQIFPNKLDMKLASANGITLKPKLLLESEEIEFENFEKGEEIDEAKIALEHPGDVDNVTTDEMCNQMRDVITALQTGAIKDPSKVNMLIWGAAGIGKTAIIKAVAKEFGFEQGNQRFIRVDLQSMDSTDFFVPYVDKETLSSGDAKKIWLPMYNTMEHDEKEGNAIANGPDGKGGVIFFDEIARCRPAVKDVVMKFFDSDRGLGTWKLGDKWILIAAANREFDQGDDDRTFHWNPILGNRFPVQVNFVPTFEEWESYMTDVDPDTGDVKAYEDIIAFLSYAKNDWFHNFDPDKFGVDGSKYVLFASPRAWEAACDLLKVAAFSAKSRKAKFDANEQARIVRRAVGKDASEAFRDFLRIKERFNPADLNKIFNDPTKAPQLWKEDKSVQLAAMAAAVYLTKDHELSDEEFDNFVTFIGLCKDPVYAMYCFKALLRAHGYLRGGDAFDKQAERFFHELYPELTADDEVELKK